MYSSSVSYTCVVSLYIDADECNLGVDNCHHNANCTNIEDGFICTCDTGYTGNGTECESKSTGISFQCFHRCMIYSYRLQTVLIVLSPCFQILMSACWKLIHVMIMQIALILMVAITAHAMLAFLGMEKYAVSVCTIFCVNYTYVLFLERSLCTH